MTDPTILITANGYTTGAIATIIPTDYTASSGALVWTRASTKTRVNASNVVESMAIDVPTFDYTDSVCPVIGVEPQRTNNFQRSEDITNAYWTKTGATASGNTQNAPDNTLTADSLIATNSTGRHEVSRVIATTGGSSGKKFIASFYAKKGNVNYAYIDGTSSVWLNTCIVDLNNGNLVFYTGNIQNIDISLINGYYRISLSNEIVGSGNATVRFGMTSSTSSVSSTLTTSDFTYMWGFQWELSDVRQYVSPTSYIPTTTASVTRLADIVLTNEANMLQYVNISEGTIFVKVNFKNNFGIRRYLTLKSVGSPSGVLYLTATETNLIQAIYGSVATITSSFYNDGILKIAFGYKANNFVLYINGVLIGTDTSGSTNIPIDAIDLTAPTTQIYNSGNELIYGAVYNQRLSNLDLAELTTL
jgi:hypothetical protein